MPTHNSVAKSVRLSKEKNPENYCPDSRCLWRTGGGYCPRHSRGEENRETRRPMVNGAPILPGADRLDCGCIRRFVRGRLQTVKCVTHLKLDRERMAPQ